MDEQDAQIGEFLGEVERILADNAELSGQLEKANSAARSTTEQVEKLASENAELEMQLASARALASEELRAALERVKSIVLSAAEVERSGGRARQTNGSQEKGDDFGS